MTSGKEDRDFITYIFPSTLLEDAISWIRDNLEPDEVFSEDKLDKWAEDSGYVKP